MAVQRGVRRQPHAAPSRGCRPSRFVVCWGADTTGRRGSTVEARWHGSRTPDAVRDQLALKCGALLPRSDERQRRPLLATEVRLQGHGSGHPAGSEAPSSPAAGRKRATVATRPVCLTSGAGRRGRRGTRIRHVVTHRHRIAGARALVWHLSREVRSRQCSRKRLAADEVGRGYGASSVELRPVSVGRTGGSMRWRGGHAQRVVVCKIRVVDCDFPCPCHYGRFLSDVHGPSPAPVASGGL
ncbi:hypothetical protein EDD99_5555 [Streptomyces sp. 846.5]|nr:hypothetical protein EDD99_5555 [Streptomyces sp. 846.5]